MPPLASEDFDHILMHTRDLWLELRGNNLFLTGGTDFFGCCLVESFLCANDRPGLNASATVLPRDAESLASNPAIYASS
jgi:dTDP-glucose 4,6-dehydratase